MFVYDAWCVALEKSSDLKGFLFHVHHDDVTREFCEMFHPGDFVTNIHITVQRILLVSNIKRSENEDFWYLKLGKRVYENVKSCNNEVAVKKFTLLHCTTINERQKYVTNKFIQSKERIMWSVYEAFDWIKTRLYSVLNEWTGALN